MAAGYSRCMATGKEWFDGKAQMEGKSCRNCLSVARDGARVRVPNGEYTMRETGLGRYELSADRGPRFELAVREVAHYVHSKR